MYSSISAVTWLAFGFKIGDLTPDHAVSRAGAGSNGAHDLDAPVVCQGRSGQHLECQRQQGVTGQYGHRFAEFLVASRLAPAQVVIVQRGQIVMNQGVGVDAFQRAGYRQNRSNIGGKYARRLETKDRAHALSPCENAVAHCAMDDRGATVLGRQQAVERGVDGQAVFFEECGERHSAGAR